jgi:hypothetical protein
MDEIRTYHFHPTKKLAKAFVVNGMSFDPVLADQRSMNQIQAEQTDFLVSVLPTENDVQRTRRISSRDRLP